MDVADRIHVKGNLERSLYPIVQYNSQCRSSQLQRVHWKIKYMKSRNEAFWRIGFDRSSMLIAIAISHPLEWLGIHLLWRSCLFQRSLKKPIWVLFLHHRTRTTCERKTAKIIKTSRTKMNHTYIKITQERRKQQQKKFKTQNMSAYLIHISNSVHTLKNT